jgi:hypothetical protein
VTQRVGAAGLVAAILASLALALTPAGKSEAIVVGTYQSFSYSPATGIATWTIRLTSQDTFGSNLQFLSVFPAGTTIISASPATCTGLPSPTPACTITAGGTLDLTLTTPFAQLCAAQVVVIGPVNYLQTVVGGPSNTITIPAASGTPGGANTVPANTALCPVATPTGTPVPNTPVPTPTVTPVPAAIAPLVIPQVFQHVPQGIFNGSRNNTPTPVRPVGTAGSTGVGLPPTGVAAMPVLRPPSTGDAGMLTLRSLKLNAW